LYGIGGNDVLIGGADADSLYGGDGDDVIAGGAGADDLYGEAGADTFKFDTALDGSQDTIHAFGTGADVIQLSTAIFKGLAVVKAGGVTSLADSAFLNLKAGESLNDMAAHKAYIIYDGAGQLSYDADGAGGKAAVYFAGLTGAPTLTASEFHIA
jgi:Ca2+-binding RTX toxin-like protein